MDGVVALAKRVQADAPLAAQIRRKFAIKCTTGYSLNALVDFPVRTTEACHTRPHSMLLLTFLCTDSRSLIIHRYVVCCSRPQRCGCPHVL